MGNKEKPAAGWYDDPESDDLLCYWDGEKFTDEFKPKPVTSRAYGNITVFSFVLGLIAFLCAVTPAYAISFLFAIPGLILGIVALARQRKPFWMSLSGLIISAVGWLVSIVVAAVVAASSLHPATSTVTTPAPAASSSQSAPSVPARSSVVWSGDGEMTTDKQALSGDYKVTLTATQDCFYGPNLEGAGHEVMPSLNATGTAESFLYGLTGDYYITMFTGPSPRCPWTLTFTPN